MSAVDPATLSGVLESRRAEELRAWVIERAGEEFTWPPWSPWRTLADAADAWSAIWHSEAIARDGDSRAWERAIARLTDDNPGDGSDGFEPLS
jgi:hypothetical protein